MRIIKIEVIIVICFYLWYNKYILSREVIKVKQVTNLQEIEREIKLNKHEVVVGKNNKNEVFVMSMEEYNKRIIKKDLISKLKKSEEEIENGEGIEADEAFRELRQKYGY